MAARPTTLSPLTVNTGAATPLTATLTTVQASSIFLQADALNTDNIYWGDSAVTATNGIALRAGEKMAITYDPVLGNNTALTLGAVYFASDQNGNKVRLAYWQVN